MPEIVYQIGNSPKFADKSDFVDFIRENKSILYADKKNQFKKADAVSLIYNVFDKSDENKAIADPSSFTGDSLRVKVVINTTNILDSHDDVHIPGLWNKTVKENKNLFLLQEHDMSFKSIISDEVKASLKDMSWKDLGLNKDGTSQALIFDTIVSKSRNQFMFEQYLRGYVKNHSVGMRYVSLSFAVNDKSLEEEYAVWQKYIGQIVNRKEAEAQGYFWAVTEAKAIEGSAVVLGSNKITPTLSVEEKEEPSKGTPENNEPDISTQKENVKQLISNFKFI